MQGIKGAVHNCASSVSTLLLCMGMMHQHKHQGHNPLSYLAQQLMRVAFHLPDHSSSAAANGVQGNPFDEEAPGLDDFDMEMDPEVVSPPAAKAKEKLKTVMKTIKVHLVSPAGCHSAAVLVLQGRSSMSAQHVHSVQLQLSASNSGYSN